MFLSLLAFYTYDPKENWNFSMIFYKILAYFLVIQCASRMIDVCM